MSKVMYMKFISPNSHEFRELLYERLKQIIIGLKEGLYTINDLFYILNAEYRLGSLTKEQVTKLLQSPSIKTLDEVFGKEVVYKINDLTLPEPPCLVVTTTREEAIKLLNQYSILTPFTSRDRIEYTVVSVFKAISLLVTSGKIVNYIVIPNINQFLRNYRFTNALKCLVILCRFANISIISKPIIQLTTEKKQIEGFITKIDLFDEDSTLVITLDTEVSSDFRPAIREFIERHGISDDLVKQITGKTRYDFELSSEWYLFGKEKHEFNKQIYDTALKLGFDKTTARKIACWKVESINDIVRLLKDLQYQFRDREYFINNVIPKICMIFNQKPEVITQLLELL